MMDAFEIAQESFSDLRRSHEALRAELAAVTVERDAWRNDAETKGDALEASRAERNHWVRKAAEMEAERDALRAKVDELEAVNAAIPVDEIRKVVQNAGTTFDLYRINAWLAC